ncbi:MAG: nucleotide exchange factor GrpE [Magnetococcales bacterium]|nr:nucleotide exchange factor GrpE [Magnetococcales bacterium]
MSKEKKKKQDQEPVDTTEDSNINSDSETEDKEEALVGEIVEDEPNEQEADGSEKADGASENDDTENSDDHSKDGDDDEDGYVPPPSLEKLYTDALAKAEANHNEYLRCVADMQNLRKRTIREVKQARSFAIEGFARDLLPVADNMVRALDAMTDSEDPAIESMRSGLEMVQQELYRAFDKHGIVKIKTENVQFDPNLHQAVVQLDTTDVEPGYVAQEMQTGYTLNDRLLRPAMVGVAKS